MDIDFDEALRVARRCIADRTGDRDAVITGYEKGDDHYFQFRTRKGDRGVVVDNNGTTRHCFEEDRGDVSRSGGSVTQKDAVDKALCFTGDGRVERVKVKDEGYEVDIGRGNAGTFRVFVDREGMVHEQKCSLLSRNLAADIE
jgi:hypothetical protein